MIQMTCNKKQMQLKKDRQVYSCILAKDTTFIFDPCNPSDIAQYQPVRIRLVEQQNIA